MKKINIAVVGCGRIAGHHCRAIKSNENFNLVAVCDLDMSKSNEYSKEFVKTTGVKYHWAYQEQEDCVYYVAVNMFPSKEARDKWIETYDDDAGTKEFQRLFEEKMGMTAEEADEKYGKEMEINIRGVEITNSN